MANWPRRTLSRIVNMPPQNHRMGQIQSALGHHFDQIPEAELAAQVPVCAQSGGIDEAAALEMVLRLSLATATAPTWVRSFGRRTSPSAPADAPAYRPRCGPSIPCV